MSTYSDSDERVHNIGATLMSYADECGCFTAGQAYYMRPATVETSIDHVLRKLTESRLIHQVPTANDWYTSSALEPFSEDRAKALWVMLVHKGERILNHDPGFFFIRGRAPFEISYILEDTAYDVMTLTEKNKANLILIDRAYKSGQEANEGPHKYIFVIENEDIIEKLPVIEAPHLFAIVRLGDIDNPVTFIEDEDTEKDED